MLLAEFTVVPDSLEPTTAMPGRPVENGSIFQSTINLCAVAVGSGVVALPYAVALIGVWPAVFTITTIAALTAMTLRWMVDCSLLSANSTFESTAKFFLGQSGYIALIVNLVLLLLGGGAAMLMVAIDNLRSVRMLSDIAPGWIEAGVMVTAVGITLAVGDHPGRLGVTSSIALGCTLYFTVLLAIEGHTAPSYHLRTSPSIGSTTTAVSIILNSFLMNFFIYSVSTTFPKNSSFFPSVNAVIGTSLFGLITPLYCTIGVVGFLTFGTEVPPNVLTATWFIAPRLVESARIALALVNVCKLPLLVIPLRRAVFKTSASKWQAPVESVGVVVAMCVAATAFSNVASLFGLIGTTCGVATAFVIPALMYFRLQCIEGEQADLARRIMTFHQSMPDSEPTSPVAAMNATRRRLGKKVASAALASASVAFALLGSAVQLGIPSAESSALAFENLVYYAYGY